MIHYQLLPESAKKWPHRQIEIQNTNQLNWAINYKEVVTEVRIRQTCVFVCCTNICISTWRENDGLDASVRIFLDMPSKTFLLTALKVKNPQIIINYALVGEILMQDKLQVL